MSSTDARTAELQRTIGLCAACRHARAQTTGRGSTFWRCLRAQDDPRFARYPPLPVLRCPGFDTGTPG